MPLIAILAYKNPMAGNFLCVFFIVANIAINMCYSYAYELKIGFLNVKNYYFLGAIIAKPWVHL